jgi:hypothetical protein
MPTLSSVNLTNLATRLGKLFGYANSIKTQTATLYGANLTSLLTQFDGTDYRQSVTQWTGMANPQSGMSSFIGQTLYNMVQNSATSLIVDTIRNEGQLYDGTPLTAYKGLRDSMIAQTASFRKVGTSSLTTTITAGNLGTGTVLSRSYRPASTDFLQEIYDETLTGTCTAPGNVLNFGAASFRIASEANRAFTNTEWPGGSGSSAIVTATPAAINGAFENWATNTPAQWTITVGTAGTQVLRSSVPARGAYSLSIVGDGSTLTTLRQQLAYSNSTPVTIQPDTDYAIIVYARKTAAGTTGVVKISLRDVSGTVITGSSEITLDLASVTTSYAVYSTSFSIAKSAVPTTVYLDIHSTTAIASGNTLIIDELVLAPMTRMYPGGPSIIIYPGTIDWAVDDSFNVDVVSTTSTNGKFMAAFARFIGMERQGVYLPVSTTPTLADSLVTI